MLRARQATVDLGGLEFRRTKRLRRGAQPRGCAEQELGDHPAAGYTDLDRDLLVVLGVPVPTPRADDCGRAMVWALRSR